MLRIAAEYRKCHLKSEPHELIDVLLGVISFHFFLAQLNCFSVFLSLSQLFGAVFLMSNLKWHLFFIKQIYIFFVSIVFRLSL